MINFHSCEFCLRFAVGSVETAHVSGLHLCEKHSEGVENFVRFGA